MPTIQIMGCGDIGRRVAGLYLTLAQAASGWVRSADSYAAGERLGLPMQLIDFDQKPSVAIEDFLDAEVIWLIPPPVQGKTDTRLEHFLQQVQSAPKRIVLISTTGVYGDCDGRWIDESEPVKPRSERAARRLNAEQRLQVWGEQFQRDWVILRVPGIYALDRLPLERIRRGEPVLLSEQAPWTNRIHADDLAAIIIAAVAKAPSTSIYNACDGCPSTMTAYFNQVADYAGLTRPPQIDLATASEVVSAGMWSYLQESRRIKNDKLLRELGIALRYPCLADALAAGR